VRLKKKGEGRGLGVGGGIWRGHFFLRAAVVGDRGKKEGPGRRARGDGTIEDCRD